VDKSLQALHTRRITNQNTPLELPTQSGSIHDFDNDAASFMSRRRSVKSGLSGVDQNTKDDATSGDGYTPIPHSPAQSQYELPRVESPTPLEADFEPKQ
jgi:hypothetical protein